tara:strand:- start:14000 stop:14722 length:723 start_codon:yes stop_codon:yes gene_type:complete
MSRKRKKLSFDERMLKLRRTISERTRDDQEWARDYFSGHNFYFELRHLEEETPISNFIALWADDDEERKVKTINTFRAALRKKRERSDKRNEKIDQSFVISLDTSQKIDQLCGKRKLSKAGLLDQLVEGAIEDMHVFEKERKTLRAEIKRLEEEKKMALAPTRLAVREVYEQLEACLWELCRISEAHKERVTLTDVQIRAATLRYHKELRACKNKCETGRLLLAFPLSRPPPGSKTKSGS